MKRFLDYEPTKEELRQIIGEGDDFVKETLEEFDQTPGGDYEKLKIARLLFVRGQEDESWKMLGTIEDEERRRVAMEERYSEWCDWSEGLI